jgi:hypothetical protein
VNLSAGQLRIVAVALIAAAGVVVVGSLGAAARAASPQTSVTIGWSALGLKPSVNLAQTGYTTTSNVPVPAGLHPAILNGVLTVGQNAGSGDLEVEDASGSILGSVALPSATSASGEVRFHVPLGGLAVSRGSARLTLALRGGSAQGCVVPPEVLLSALSTTFTGTPAQPRTIDDFFPPVLQRITIDTDAQPTLAEQQAVLTLTAALTAHYAGLPPTIAVGALPPGGAVSAPPASPLDRTVVVREGGSAGIALSTAPGGAAILQVSGTGAALTRQASVFATSLSSLLHAPRAVAESAPARAVRSTASQYTFSQLGLSAGGQVVGAVSSPLTLPEGVLGGPLNSITVHMLGTYTPVTAPGRGTLTASVGGVLLAGVGLGPSGKLDTTFTIPRQLLSSSTQIQLTVDYGPGTLCGPVTPPLSFSIFPWSSITVARQVTPSGGFATLPGSFLRGMNVAVQGGSTAALNAAAIAVSGLQTLTGTQLEPTVIPFGQGATSRTSTVIAADSASVRRLRLNPPLALAPGQISAQLVGAPSIAVSGGAGAIEVFADPSRRRTVLLVTTTGAWSLLDPVFSALSVSGWFGLSGDTYASVNGGPVRKLTLRSSGVATFTPPPPPPSKGWAVTFIVVGGVALAILAFIFGGWYAIRRRSGAYQPRYGIRGRSDRPE